MVVLASISPPMRENFAHYTYIGGSLLGFISALIMFRNGRNFEKFWGFAFLFLSAHQFLNLLDNITVAPYIGDIFYMGFYFLLFTGNILYLWESQSVGFITLIFVLSGLSVVSIGILVMFVPLFKKTPFATFFNLFYVSFSAINMIATLRAAMFDRAWILRTLAFGIFLISEIWFMEWLYIGIDPGDPSVMWFGVVMLAVLSQRPVSRRMRIMR